MGSKQYLKEMFAKSKRYITDEKAFELKQNLDKEINNFFLAGGVTCENVENMIKTASPYCIDVSSGVETDGVKDEEKIKKIIYIVRKQ